MTTIDKKTAAAPGLIILTGRWETVTQAIKPEQLIHFHILCSPSQQEKVERWRSERGNSDDKTVMTGWKNAFRFYALRTNLKRFRGKYDKVIAVYNTPTGVGYFFVNLFAFLLFPKMKKVCLPDCRIIPLRIWSWGLQVLARRLRLDTFFYSLFYWPRLWFSLHLLPFFRPIRIKTSPNENTGKNHVLFVSAILLLNNAGVSVRARKFLSYSSEFNWNVHALTACDSWMDHRDKSDWIEKNDNISIAPLPSRHYRLLRWMRIPDNYGSWIFDAVKRGRETINRHPVSVIYSTAKPYSNHLVALILHKITRLPLVIEFRDEWTRLPFQNHSPLRRFIEKRQERSVIRTAVAVITNTSGQQENFINHYSDIPASRFHMIPNGFDPADFNSILSAPQLENPVLLTYVGNISPIRTLKYLLEAIQILLNTDEGYRNRFRFRIVGFVPPHEREQLSNSHISDMFELTGPVSHGRAVGYMMETDMLITITHPRSHRYTAGKTYEYLYTGKPILALVPVDGDAARLIREYGRGITVEPHDAVAIAKALEKCGRQDINIKWPPMKPGENKRLEKFNRRRLVGDICTLLDHTREKDQK